MFTVDRKDKALIVEFEGVRYRMPYRLLRIKNGKVVLRGLATNDCYIEVWRPDILKWIHVGGALTVDDLSTTLVNYWQILPQRMRRYYLVDSFALPTEPR